MCVESVIQFKIHSFIVSIDHITLLIVATLNGFYNAGVCVCELFLCDHFQVALHFACCNIIYRGKITFLHLFYCLNLPH